MATPKVYAVILTWNQLQDTQECLDSLLSMDVQPDCFVVVDNGSTDNTAEVILSNYPMVSLVQSERNLGVAGGYNLGIEFALERDADYVLIMNNDIIVKRDFLKELLKVAQTQFQVGIVQPKIYHYYGDRSRIWIVGARWRSFPPEVKLVGTDIQDDESFKDITELEFVPSCALLISRPALEKAGIFDPNYFFYFDDWDFSIRIRQAGFKIYFAPQAKMWHKVSESTVKKDKSGKWWYIRGQSSVRFYSKYKNLRALFFANVWFVVREIIKMKFNRVIPYIAGVISGHARRKNWETNLVTSITTNTIHYNETSN